MIKILRTYKASLLTQFLLCLVFTFSSRADTTTILEGESIYFTGGNNDIVNNYGEAIIQDSIIGGIFNNYGHVIARGAFSIAGGVGNGSN